MSPSYPVIGVKRPSEGSNEGKAPALGDDQARALLDAPPADTLKGKRDRAILAIFLYHGLRCSELIDLRVRDIERRRDIAKVQEWLGHATIATTRLYDRRKMRSEDSPTFKVSN